MPEGNENVCSSGSGRAIKRTKSSPKISSKYEELRSSPTTLEVRSNLNRVRSHEDVTALRSACSYPPPSSPQCATQKQPRGDFHRLPIELMYTILNYLPIGDISRLALSSKDFRDFIILWTESVRFQGRLIPHFRLATERDQWILPSLRYYHQSMPFPHDFRLECLRIGELFKRLTCLFATHRRLSFLKCFLDSMEKLTQKEIATDTHHLMGAVRGTVLHALIAGWDRRECAKVFTILCQLYSLHPLLNSFLESSPGLSAQSERFLRLHLRTLFLDFCKENDKSIWVPIVLDPENRTNSQVAQLIVLLYAPVKEQGHINWDFADDEEVISHGQTYVMLANTMAQLPNRPLKLLDSVIATPREWGSGPISALFLYMQKRDKKLISAYFKHLSSNHQTGDVIRLLSEITYISSSLASSSLDLPYVNLLMQDPVEINARAVLNVFRLALNCGWEQTERNHIIDLTWDVIELNVNSYMEDYLLNGDDDELFGFLDTIKEMCIRLSY